MIRHARAMGAVRLVPLADVDAVADDRRGRA
jgi:hypothetical protein